MTDTPRLSHAAQLLNKLQHSEELKQQPIAAVGLDPQLAMLREWQAHRLARTYADLLADPGYSPACEFFLSDLYAPRDFSQRDHDLERLHRFLARVLPAQMIQGLTETVELNSLTNTLDNRLVRVLVEQLGVTDTITPELYVEAYRLCDNYTERVRQIDLTRSILMRVGAGARRKRVGVAMKLAKVPAQRAGWIDLYDFLQRGRQAFRQMKDVKTFVDTIARREMNILDLIYAADLQGFEKLAGLS
jgi:hypothetical protein